MSAQYDVFGSSPKTGRTKKKPSAESKKDQFKRFEVDPYIHKQCFRSLFTQPFIALPGAGDLEERAVNLKAQLILHAKFSLEFLFQEGTGGLVQDNGLARSARRVVSCVGQL